MAPIVLPSSHPTTGPLTSGPSEVGYENARYQGQILKKKIFSTNVLKNY